ncbi:MAG: MoaD/ThiS family protein [Candidatus Bathyarchaeota archaeon]|nr:MAG: MoaD/ThiS family protein [Candidatus Bathyarchaeota archaeon]
MVLINVELIGVLRKLAGANTIDIELEDSAAVSGLLQKLSKELFQSEETLSRSTLLIMKNGLEINVLKGVHTELNHDDVITLVPISHGG